MIRSSFRKRQVYVLCGCASVWVKALKDANFVRQSMSEREKRGMLRVYACVNVRRERERERLLRKRGKKLTISIKWKRKKTKNTKKRTSTNKHFLVIVL